jgi:hypothetical protein
VTGRPRWDISPEKNGSPPRTKARTFKAVFTLPPANRRKKARERRVKRSYQNPVVLAQSWQKYLKEGEFRKPADLARRFRFSRARVTQILRLLKLDPYVVAALVALGDRLPKRLVTERAFRGLVDKPARQQRAALRALLERLPRSWAKNSAGMIGKKGLKTSSQ